MTTLSIVLQAAMARAHVGSQTLSQLTGVPRTSIDNWRDGSAQRPKHWRPLLQIAQTLALSHEEVDALLRAAQHPPLATLAQTLGPDDPDARYLAPWQPRTPLPTTPDLAHWMATIEAHLAALRAHLAPQRAAPPPGTPEHAAPAVPLQDGLGGDVLTIVAQRLAPRPTMPVAPPTLPAAPDHTPTADIATTWEHGLMAIQHATYATAERLFQRVVATARTAHPQLSQRGLLWIAYCQQALGNYPLAESIAASLTDSLPPTDATVAEAWLIRGLIAADIGSLHDAAHHLTHARQLACLRGDRTLDARCCANLAPICIYLGDLAQAGHLIQHVEQRYQAGDAPLTSVIQVHNANLYRLRFLGDLVGALRLGRDRPTASAPVSRHVRGWFALSTAAVATDADHWAIAEAAWDEAQQILHGIDDHDFTQAELRWEQAWRYFRQGRDAEAQAAIASACALHLDGMGTERAHAWAISAIIAHAQGALAWVGVQLHNACACFRAAHHQLGVLSVLIHLADYHGSMQRPAAAQRAFAEALVGMWRMHLFNTYYWLPATMARLLRIAIAEAWDPDAQAYLHTEALASMDASMRADSSIILGEFATEVAVCRLATSAWRVFLPLLDDERPQVRRRIQRILMASEDPAVPALLVAREMGSHRGE